jgi:hypothetical protein
MAVLGKNIPGMFYSPSGDPEKDYQLTGAVCIVFWDCGNPEYVCIDDYLPT